MLYIAFIVVIAMHLVAMNVATAAPLLCIWLKRREVRREDAEAGRMGQFLAWQSITSLVAGMVLGLVAAGILWARGEERFFAVLAIVPRRRLWFGLLELLFFLALMAWYARAWPRVRRPTFWHPALAILAATDLVYHFPPLFAAIAALKGASTLPGAELTYSEFLALMMSPQSVARVLHFLLASVAVTAGVMLVHLLRQNRHNEKSFSAHWIAWSSRLALAPSLLQLLAGVFLLMTLPAGQQQRLMGGDLLATALFGGSVLGVFALLHHLAALALGETVRSVVVRSLGLLALIVLAMSALR